MRYLVIGWSFFAVTMTLIIWAARPDMIESAVTEITAPYREYQERKAEEIWNEAKEQQRAAIEILECKNFKSERAKEFERVWQINIARGWKPEGL